MDEDKGRSGESNVRPESEQSISRDRTIKERENLGNLQVRISKAESITLDKWQKEVIDEVEINKFNLAIRAGRQVGKSTVISIAAGRYAVNNVKSSIMIISATERQAYLLFLKVLNYLHDNYRKYIKMGKDRPTKTQINLTNGSTIRCLPTGQDGLGIRGYTVNLLIADEAAFVNKDVWQAVIPMLATTGGRIILLSTPMGKSGYFYDRFKDEAFKTWHINAEDVADSRLEPQKTFMKHHQEESKRTMSILQYMQEYCGEFVDEMRQVFPLELIKKCCILKRRKSIIKNTYTPKDYYLGVDIARMGADNSSFQILDRMSKIRIEQVESKLTSKTLTTDTHDMILYLNEQYNFKKIGIDAGAGSLGVGVLDFLLREQGVRNKIVCLNNLHRELDRYGERKRTLLKFDMYINLKAMMEMGIIKLLDDEEVINSLRAIQFEYSSRESKKATINIFASRHQDTDLVEGLMRAAWLANQKTINTRISYI